MRRSSEVSQTTLAQIWSALKRALSRLLRHWAERLAAVPEANERVSSRNGRSTAVHARVDTPADSIQESMLLPFFPSASDNTPPEHWLRRRSLGPPEHWVAKVRESAPELLEPAPLASANIRWTAAVPRAPVSNPRTQEPLPKKEKKRVEKVDELPRVERHPESDEERLDGGLRTSRVREVAWQHAPKRPAPTLEEHTSPDALQPDIGLEIPHEAQRHRRIAPGQVSTVMVSESGPGLHLPGDQPAPSPNTHYPEAATSRAALTKFWRTERGQSYTQLAPAERSHSERTHRLLSGDQSEQVAAEPTHDMRFTGMPPEWPTLPSDADSAPSSTTSPAAAFFYREWQRLERINREQRGD